MKVEWNKVTWYSKAIALGLFVALVIAAFWFGVGFGEFVVSLAGSGGAAAPTSTPQTALSGAEYYSNVSEWQPYADAQGGYTIAYPIDFPNDENYVSAPTMDWQLNSSSTLGILGFTLTIPASFEPQTNFSDAKLTVGWSGGADAVAQCLAPEPSGGPSNSATSSVAIGGTTFTVFPSTGVGAGNYYETTSYHTVHAGRCYVIEYTIHSGQIANYPASYHLRPFDEAPLTDLLGRIVGTFKFE